ncbi:MAG: transketolase [Prevotellaceae bacterium]|jgi:transketolase|nr:transketolase [Prevotellaceae bacterium]
MAKNKETINYLTGLALDIRRRIINIAHNVKGEGVHFGGALSIVDILAALYGYIMNFNPVNPLDNERDRFILSKGHDCIALYATLNAIGCITDSEIKDNYLTNQGFLPEHPIKNLNKGIECSCGSLGMGLSFAVGKALAAKLNNRNYMVFAILGDGECNEGSCWEAMMAAKQYELNNLVMIIDKNRLQLDGNTKEIMDVNLFSGISAMGWKVIEVDGHNIEVFITSLDELMQENNNLPVAIIANTIKGKGISFMENNNIWHHGHLSEEQYEMAMNELQVL